MMIVKKFQPLVREAIDLIWQHYDAESAKRGQKMLQQAAAAGDADAWALLARTYMGIGESWENSGFPIAEDTDEVHRCLQKSIEGGSAAGVLCAIEHRGLTPVEHAAMLAHWETPAAVLEEIRAYAAAEPMVAYLLGAAYKFGGVSLLLGDNDGQRERLKQALPFIEAAVDSGLAYGLDLYKTCVRDMYRGDGNPEKIAKFRRLEDGFCRAGVPHALYSRGEDLFNQEKYAEALGYYEKAAAAGLDSALYSLGYMYRHGLGVKEDSRKAFEEYFLPLAVQGHVVSMYQVADTYFWGDFFACDYAKAYEWCQKAMNRVVQFHGFYDYDVLMPLICYCKLYGRGTSMERNLAARSIREEMLREEQKLVLPRYKRALLQYLMAEVYAHGYGPVAQNEELAEKYRREATEYEGFKVMLEKMSWETENEAEVRNWKNSAATNSRPAALAEAETIRDRQEARIAAADGRRQWRLCTEWRQKYGLVFSHYNNAELQAALAMLANDKYRSVALNSQQAGENYLEAYHEQDGYYLLAAIDGRAVHKQVKELPSALAVLTAWADGQGLHGEDWQADEEVAKNKQWNEYLQIAQECEEREDTEGRIKALTAAADSGCGYAMNLLGVINCQNLKTASTWFLKATLTSDPEDVAMAWYSLGKLHKENPQGDKLAILRYLQKAADMGYAKAWLEMGICYLRGIGTIVDYEKGVACYEKAIAMGDYETMLARAHLCRDAEGEWHDLDTAIAVLERVAYEKNDENEWQNEGRVMLANALLAKDKQANYTCARDLVREAAGEGFAEGAWNLAHFYKDEGNFTSYRKLLRRTAEEGYQPAQEELDHIYDTSEWSECL